MVGSTQEEADDDGNGDGIHHENPEEDDDGPHESTLPGVAAVEQAILELVLASMDSSVSEWSPLCVLAVSEPPSGLKPGGFERFGLRRHLCRHVD